MCLPACVWAFAHLCALYVTRSCPQDGMLLGRDRSPRRCVANSAPAKPRGRQSGRPIPLESICWEAGEVSALVCAAQIQQVPMGMACLPYGAVIPELRAAAAIRPAVIMAQDPYMTHRCMVTDA